MPGLTSLYARVRAPAPHQTLIFLSLNLEWLSLVGLSDEDAHTLR